MLEIVWAKRAVHQWETFAKKDFRAVDSWDHNLDIKKLVGTAECCLRNKKKSWNHTSGSISSTGCLILKCVFWIDSDRWKYVEFVWRWNYSPHNANSTYADFGLCTYAQVGEFCVSWIISTVPLTQFLRNTIFFKKQNVRNAGDTCGSEILRLGHLCGTTSDYFKSQFKKHISIWNNL